MSVMTRPESAMVSVVIPTYNRAYCLPLAIDSVLAQAHDPLEVLVIDDGSTDDTRECVARLYGSEPRVRYIHQPNKGVSAARNTGLRQIRGDYVAFLDSDDRWLPGKLKLQLDCLNAVPEAGMVSTDMQAIDPEGAVIHPRYLQLMYSGHRRYSSYRDLYSGERVMPGSTPPVRFYWGDIFSQMVLGNLVHTSTVLIRRNRLNAAGYFREDLRTGEDFHFHLRVCREGPVAFIDLATIQYRIGSADALTKPALHLDIAKAYIMTLHEVLERDGNRITVPAHVIADSRARAYAWAGRTALDADRAGEARTWYLKSLQLRPLRLSTLQFFVVSVLPRPVRGLLATAVRRLRALT